MKKFLFTLVALLLAGAAFAQEEYLFIEDFEVPQSVLQGATAKARRMTIPVMAHFDRYVNVWQVDIALPEGAVCKAGTAGAGMTDIPFMNELGEMETENIALNKNLELARFIGVISNGGYWYPEGTDPDEDDPVMYGAVKFPLGEYEMFTMTVQFDDPAFTGCEMEVYTQPASSSDQRGPVCDATKSYHYCTVTVEQAEPVVAEAPVFAVDENYTITATFANEYKVFVNGEEVTLPYTVEQTYEDQHIVVTGYGYAEGMENSETVTFEFDVPAMEMPVAEAPVFTMDENYVIDATCANDYVAYVNGVEATMPYQVEQTEEEQTIVVSGYGYGEDMQNSEMVEVTFVVPAMDVPEPEVTAAPVITYEVTEDGVVVTATGDGEVILYVDGEEVENPYTAIRLEEAYDIVVYATAQEEGKEMGVAEEMVITVPAVEVTPEDPHMVGYWLVVIDEAGLEHWFELMEGDNHDWTTTVALDYTPYGTFPPEKPELRPYVPFYFMVDGVRYGAENDETVAYLGDAMQNPLYNGENNYQVLVGYSYTLGIAIEADAEGNPYVDEQGNELPKYYAYAAKAGLTGLDEVNGGKTVAGVRYFNMAGQEMSEANGICIAVTTYTDGTTSAVKVMK